MGLKKKGTKGTSPFFAPKTLGRQRFCLYLFFFEKRYQSLFCRTACTPKQKKKGTTILQKRYKEVQRRSEKRYRHFPARPRVIKKKGRSLCSTLLLRRLHRLLRYTALTARRAALPRNYPATAADTTYPYHVRRNSD